MAINKAGVDGNNLMVTLPIPGWCLLCHTLEVLLGPFPLGVSERLVMTVDLGRPNAVPLTDVMG